MVTAQGWFAARPSGTEDVSKITAEDTEKITLVQKLAEEQIDFDFIDSQLD